jgi:F-type H+-transporting ATPase subunit gamma
MQKVASAKLTQDLLRIGNANTYFQKTCDMLRLAHNELPSNAAIHPLMNPQPGNTISMIVFGSDRGLCGSFNTQLMEAVQYFIKAQPESEIQIYLRGKVVYRRALRLKMPKIHNIEDTQEIADLMQKEFLTKKAAKIYILYWDYITGANQTVVTEQIIPTPFTEKKSEVRGQGSGGRSQRSDVRGQGSEVRGPNSALIEPSASALIDALLPEYVRCSIHNGYFNSLVTENTMRRASMSRATENAGEMLTELKKTHSRLRQTSITTEMLEIIAGMER